MPHLVAMARAVLMLSPVTIRTVMPARWHFLMASGTFEGGGAEPEPQQGEKMQVIFLQVWASLLDVKLLQLPERGEALAPAPFLFY